MFRCFAVVRVSKKAGHTGVSSRPKFAFCSSANGATALRTDSILRCCSICTPQSVLAGSDV
jgi:hypothetical protein